MADELDDTPLQRSPQVVWRRLLDGVLVLGTEMSEPQRINDPGDVLWEMLAVPRRFSELVVEWSATFGIDETQARADIEPVVRAWLSGGALTASAG